MNLWPDYCKQIEDVVSKIDYLYSGDVISSIDKKQSFNINLRRISTTNVISIINSIAEESILKMITDTTDCKMCSTYNLGDHIKEICKSKFAFGNQTFINYFKTIAHVSNYNKGTIFDKFMYKELSQENTDIYCIDEILNRNSLNSNNMIVYTCDKPIQSLVYTINTTTYLIENNIHTMEYKIFNCQFKSNKFIIRNIENDREHKLNIICQ